jgi:hypothetical protein
VASRDATSDSSVSQMPSMLASERERAIMNAPDR